VELTPTFVALLDAFRDVFTAPSFRLFVLLLTGWTLSCRHRYITECIFSSGQVDVGHWARFHRFFSHNAWCLDHLCRILARILVSHFCPEGVVLLAADDTLCRKRGLNLFGAGMHHDPLLSSKALKVCSWGHDWVIVSLIVRCPAWAPTRVFALPLAFRLYTNRQGLTKGKKRPKAPKGQAPKKRQRAAADPNHRTRPQLLVELLELLSQWFPDRQMLVCADSAYGGKSVLQHLPKNIDLISQVHPRGALYALPTPQPADVKPRGRPAKKGKRLPDLSGWADDPKSAWQELVFDQYGLHTTLAVKVQQALYYKAGKDRLLTVVLTRDREGKRPDHRFYCTRLDWDVRAVLSAYASRWSAEVTHESAKQLLGLEDPANRLPKAVKRTAPMALVLCSLIVLWFDQVGHEQVRFPRRPWYRRKREPSLADMLTTLRRLSWEERLAGVASPDSPAGKKIAEFIEMATRAG
jgi:hypothetical protein